ncbi:MAG: PRC-barrel domain-containing protein, partial [Hyphomicrobiaceae bacterium]
KSLPCLFSSAALGALLLAVPALAETPVTPDKSPSTTERTVPDAAKPGSSMDRTLDNKSDPGAAATNSARTPNPALADLRASNLIGTKIYNAQNESIGSINDLLLDSSGSIDRVVVGVGGFLGMGERNVALKFSDVDVRKDGKSYRATVSLTKTQLEALPQWKAPN